MDFTNKLELSKRSFALRFSPRAGEFPGLFILVESVSCDALLLKVERFASPTRIVAWSCRNPKRPLTPRYWLGLASFAEPEKSNAIPSGRAAAHVSTRKGNVYIS